MVSGKATRWHRDIRYLFIFAVLSLVISCCHGEGYHQTSLRITWEQGNPDGGKDRPMIKVNGSFPAPDLVFDEGDFVEITVYNDMKDQNISMHWHGISMMNSPWSDGTPGMVQKQIMPGEDFIYRFLARPSGQHWYHSHSMASMMDGLYGSLLVRRKPDALEPWHRISEDAADIAAMKKAARNPKPILVSDWSHVTSEEYMRITRESNVGTFCSDSFLINGKGSVYCPGKSWLYANQAEFMNETWKYPITVTDKGCFPYVPKTVGLYWTDRTNLSAIPPGFVDGCMSADGSTEVITVDPSSGWVSLNFINAGSITAPRIGIDQHFMWVYEVDGQLIEPIKTEVFGNFVGERYSVMVKLDQKHQDYPLRATDSGFTQILGGFAIIRYESPETQSLDLQNEDWYALRYRGEQTTPWQQYNGVLINNATLMDQNKIHPYPSWDPTLRPAAKSDDFHVFDMTRIKAGWRTVMNFPNLFPADYGDEAPLLHNPNSAEALDERYVVRTKNGTWVDLVLQLAGHGWWPADGAHPMHKHGTKFWVIGQGEGEWDFDSIEEAMAEKPDSFNLVNPQLRDTYANDFSRAQWVVFRYHVTQPGPWLFHCHVETHLVAGMAVALLDGVDTWPTVPFQYAPDRRGHLLPGETGYEHLHQAKKHPLWKKILIPVVAFFILVVVCGAATVLYLQRKTLFNRKRLRSIGRWNPLRAPTIALFRRLRWWRGAKGVDHRAETNETKGEYQIVAQETRDQDLEDGRVMWDLSDRTSQDELNPLSPGSDSDELASDEPHEGPVTPEALEHDDDESPVIVVPKEAHI